MIDEENRRRTLTDSLERKNRAMLDRVKRSGVQVIPKHLDRYNQGQPTRKPGKTF